MASDGIRVGALGSSPLRDLSHALEARAQELETVIAGLDEVIAEQSAERTRVRLALAQAEAVRAQIMEYRRLVRPEVLVGALRRSGELYARMRSLDSRLEGLAERRAGMQSERDQLGQIRPLAVELGADQGARLVTADDPQVVCRRAERPLLRLGPRGVARRRAARDTRPCLGGGPPGGRGGLPPPPGACGAAGSVRPRP